MSSVGACKGVVRDNDGGMDVEVIGGKFNLTDIAARIGLGQLAAPGGIQRVPPPARAALLRRTSMPRLGCGLPPADFENGNWHMFQITLPLERLSISRGEFIRAMQKRGIGVGVHYPAMHLFSALPRARLQGGRLPAGRTHRPRHRHAAAVSGDGRWRRRARVRRGRRDHPR